MAHSKPLAREYNILLLGESGNGKSLFINSFANYLKHESFESACQCEEVTCLIPFKAEIEDTEGEDREIGHGEDANESKEIIQSGTLMSQSYVFEVGQCRVRLIDSAGVGAAEGMEADSKNMEDVLDYICHFDNIHAIAIFLMANRTKLNTSFKYCMTQILTKLSKSAAANLIFILTHCDSKKSADVKQPLKNYLKTVNCSKQEIEIKLDADRTYKFDNKAFHYVIADKAGIEFNEDVRNDCAKIWKHSAKECHRMLKFIIGSDNVPGLKPHNVKLTKTMTEARKFIEVVRPFIDEILETIESNRRLLSRLSDEYQKDKEEGNRPKSMPVIQLEDIEVIALKQARTVCTSIKCSPPFQVGDTVKQHFTKVCCEGCPITMGKRLFCWAFKILNGECKYCKCHVNDHLRCYFKTQKVTKDFTIPVSDTKLVHDDRTERYERLIQAIVNKQKILEHEKDVIETAMVKFAMFLKANAIVEPSKEVIEELEMKTKHVENVGFAKFEPKAKTASSAGVMLDKCVADMAASQVVKDISPVEILVIRRQLFGLQEYGPKIESVWQIALKGKEEESKNREKFMGLRNTLVEEFQWL